MKVHPGLLVTFYEDEFYIFPRSHNILRSIHSGGKWAISGSVEVLVGKSHFIISNLKVELRSNSLDNTSRNLINAEGNAIRDIF